MPFANFLKIKGSMTNKVDSVNEEKKKLFFNPQNLTALLGYYN